MANTYERTKTYECFPTIAPIIEYKPFGRCVSPKGSKNVKTVVDRREEDTESYEKLSHS